MHIPSSISVVVSAFGAYQRRGGIDPDIPILDLTVREQLRIRAADGGQIIIGHRAWLVGGVCSSFAWPQPTADSRQQAGHTK